MLLNRDFLITEVRVHRYSANKKKTEIDHRHDNHSVITSNLWHFISYRVIFDAIHVFPILFFGIHLGTECRSVQTVTEYI